MNDSDKWERMLRQALASPGEPEEKLNQSILNRVEERNSMNHVYRKRLSTGVMVAILTLVMSVTAIAATQFFSSDQVAVQLGEKILAKAFESSDAIEVNKSVDSGDYKFTLHGIVSGAGLKELNESNSTNEIHPERTYAVVSIARQDGRPMPKTSDPEYGEESFFISPLIKGLKPWQVNIASMRGGYSEVVLNGIQYRLIECDYVEMFADRGVYLAVSSGSPFYNSEAFAYNESTGEVTAKSDYDGVSLLMDLPLDKAKADPAKAEAYLKELLKEPESGTKTDPAETELANRIEELKKRLADGKVIPESVKEVTYDKEGRINYEYDGWSVKLSPEMLFAEGQTGFSDSVQFSEADGHYLGLQFHKDEKGVITGMVIDLK
ncbi:hypothetical protein [Brevibacillus panacihumi]|uniref:DUF4179 domain-containing protein n=1 Tax=Brevibacillus panacihumi TaxID=497735 RepID=A0A3M8C1W4_9BACL|nr:hypothetical protein [Brevibacillus panacihumi]RNB69591.1 hypothetical protein EDM58_24000 [Brevibacillus panacihumi]